MQTVHYRRWSPPSGSVEVEFSASVLETVQNSLPTTSHEEAGLLLGFQQGTQIRLVEALGAESGGTEVAAELGLAVVGIYSIRKHGAVFLTERDLARMERKGARIALVIAAQQAGFFVRETDGTIQAICSHQEFSLTEVLAPESPSVHEKPQPRSATSSRAKVPARAEASARQAQDSAFGGLRRSVSRIALPLSSLPRLHSALIDRWSGPAVRRQANHYAECFGPMAANFFRSGKRTAREALDTLKSPTRHPLLPPPNRRQWVATAGCLLLIPIAALAYFQPRVASPPIAISMHEVAGQLVVGWDPTATRDGGRLEIVDRGRRVNVELTPGSGGVTYAYSGSDVEVRLVSDRRAGRSAWIGTRFVAPVSRSAEQNARVQSQLSTLRREAEMLRTTLASRQQKVNELRRKTETLLPREVADR